jgi:ABC-type multidrug transport system fused ATPase/permease subunit
MSSSPRHDVTNLVELEERRESLRKRLRIWHLLFPAGDDDLRAYRSLLKFVRPYRGKLVLSIVFAMSSAIFVGAELGLMNGALSMIFSGPTNADAAEQRSTAAEQPPATEAVPATEPKGRDEGDRTLVRRVKEWWDERRIALENWIYDRCGVARPNRVRQEAHRPTALHLDEDEKARRHVLLGVLCGLLVTLVVLASFAKYGQSVIVTGASRRVVRDIRAAVFGHLMGLSVRFHQKNH